MYPIPAIQEAPGEIISGGFLFSRDAQLCRSLYRHPRARSRNAICWTSSEMNIEDIGNALGCSFRSGGNLDVRGRDYSPRDDASHFGRALIVEAESAITTKCPGTGRRVTEGWRECPLMCTFESSRPPVTMSVSKGGPEKPADDQNERD